MIELRWLHKKLHPMNDSRTERQKVLQMRQPSHSMTPVFQHGHLITIESAGGMTEWQDIPVVEEE